MPWISRPWAARMASSSGPRSNVDRYSDPSNLNLIAFTRLALSAKVAQPIVTPMSTPAMKPNWTNEQCDGEQRGIFEQRDPPRGIDQPLIHQARAEIEKQASEDEFGDVGDEARIDREHQDRSSSDGEPANRAAAACGVYQRCPAKRNAAHIAADQPGHRVRRAKRLELSAKLRLAARGKLDSCGIEQHGDGSHEHHGKNVAAQARQDAPWELSDVAKVPCRREPNRGW